MYPDREKLAAEARRMRAEGLSVRKIAARIGVGRTTVCRWTAASGRGRKVVDLTGDGLPWVSGGGPAYPDIAPSDKDALIDRLMLENDILRGMNEILKGVRPGEATNREKALLIDWLRARTGRSLRELTASLRVSRSSYDYQRRAIARGDRYAQLRKDVRRIFARDGGSARGYRFVHAALRDRGVRVSEKVVRRLMREEGLVCRWAKRRRRPYSSYAGEATPAPPNLVRRDFRSALPNRLWLTDITEFRIPAGKCYLSAIRDCFDGYAVAWRVGRRADAELANRTLADACARLAPGERPVVHSDRGGHYRWPGWIEICERNGLVRSMSAKGCSPDNAAMEGFFGLVKREFFHGRDWSSATLESFMSELDSWLGWYNEGRPCLARGFATPSEFRRTLGGIA